MKNYLEAVLDLITLVWFGERVPGEPIKPPTFTTTIPDNQPGEYEWMKMFRVSSLHKVDQRIFFESK